MPKTYSLIEEDDGDDDDNDDNKPRAGSCLVKLSHIRQQSETNPVYIIRPVR
jgi:hypothetical protein